MKNTPDQPCEPEPGANVICEGTYKPSEFVVLCIGPFCQALPMPFFREEF